MIWTILGGYLTLPVATAVDLPILPAFDKSTVPALAALAFCVLSGRNYGPLTYARSWLPETIAARVALIAFLLLPLITVALNAAPAVAGGRTLRGLTMYDGASLGLDHLMVVLPFLLARRYLADPAAHRVLVAAIALGGVAYAIPILIELRLSPQLHNWVYGFFPHSFVQQIRSGGFRPVVFLGHGLLVAMFVAGALIASVSVWRASMGPVRTAWGAVVIGFVLLLVLCKSMGPLILGLVGAALVGLGPRAVVRLAVLAMVGLVLAYPALRTAGALPVESLVGKIEQIQPARAQSLQFRLDNEDALLDRSHERPVFGWGGWSRNRVYDANGYDLSTTDGHWIITLGQFGWLGYMAEFGLLSLGLILLAGPTGRSLPFPTGALAVMLAINLMDLLPNASLTPVSWLIAGALLGTAEALQRGNSPSEALPRSSPRLSASNGATTRRAPARLR
ncbi:MAG: hypothetical protein AB8B85_03525 [Paracoccaceae bacterium]